MNAPGQREVDAFDRIAELFETLRTQKPADRERLLNDGSIDDDTQREVRELLAHYDADVAAGAMPVSVTLECAAPTDAPAAESGGAQRSFSGFRLLRILGEGGSGVVWLAEQERPQRLVAIKMLRPGSAARSIARRLTREMEILARFDHPGIAQILQAGETDLGFGLQPFFAMEFIDGLSITEHVRARRLGTRDRLSLIIDVARAVHHAHERGIVHRDLKPENVLVDPDGRPRVLDFGIARLMESDRHTLRTATGQIVGTLGFMSPEQLSGNSGAIDARSDVYALGALMFELLTDQPPFDLEGRPLTEALRVLRDDEPPPLGSIDRQFRGDIEQITQAAMAREPQRRYASAADFADDVARYLANLPIRARGQGPVYRATKFVRRHRTLVTAAAAVFLVLCAATIVSIDFAMDAEAQRREAAAAAARATRHATVSGLAAAAADLRSGNIAAAAARIEALPESHRATWEARYLHAALDTSEMLRAPGSIGIRTLCFIDKETWVIGDESGSFRLQRCDLDIPLAAHDGRAVAAAVLHVPHGRVLLSAGHDRMVQATMIPAAPAPESVPPPAPSWQRHFEHPISAMAACPARTVIAAVLARGEIVLIDAATGDVLATHRSAPRGTTVSLTFDPAGTQLAIANGNTIEIFDAASLELQRTIDIGAGQLSGCAWSFDGAHLAASLHDGSLLWLDAADGALRDRTRLSLPGSFIFSLAAHPSQPIVAAGLHGGPVAVWRAGAGMQPTLHTGAVSTTTSVAWSEDGEMLLAGGLDNTVRRWRPAAANDDHTMHRAGIAGGALRVTQSDDHVTPDILLILGDVMGRAQIVHPDTGSWTPSSLRLGTVVSSIAIAPGARSALMLGEGSGIWRLDPASHELSGPHTLSAATPALVAALDAETYVIATREGALVVCDADGTERTRASVHDAGINALAVSPGGDFVAASAFNDSVIIIAAHSRGAEHSFELESLQHIAIESPSALLWSPDGRTLWIGDHAGTLHAIDASTALPRGSVRVHARGIFAIAQSADGTRVVTGSTDRTIRVLDADALDEVLVLSDHDSAVRWLGFLPDGSLLSAGLDGLLRRHRVAHDAVGTDPPRAQPG